MCKCICYQSSHYFHYKNNTESAVGSRNYKRQEYIKVRNTKYVAVTKIQFSSRVQTITIPITVPEMCTSAVPGFMCLSNIQLQGNSIPV